MLPLEIRKAEPADIPAILALLGELADYERLRERVTVDERLLEQHLFSERRFAEALLGLANGKPVCYALYYPVLPSFGGRPWLYIEDLYVRPEARRGGVGHAMMARLARIALDRGWTALAWGVLDWNEPAFAFYGKLGAVRSTGTVQMELHGEALARLASLAPA
jgi:GNAT superfamily N-acetyltransferase